MDEISSQTWDLVQEGMEQMVSSLHKEKKQVSQIIQKVCL